MTVIGTSAIPAVDTASIDHPVDPSPPPAVDSIVSETGIEAPTIAPTLPATQTHGKPVPATRRDSVLRNIMSS
ncbi:MAG: hypothetical protein JXA71_00655, partial [Chitinispirillaceae bacterium]|nr:hypothetical protein [Chitinispirillaceae bacterium]